jgi:hypothetical protein
LGFDFFLRIQAASLPQVWQPFQGQFRTVIDSDRWLITSSLDAVTLGVQAVICCQQPNALNEPFENLSPIDPARLDCDKEQPQVLRFRLPQKYAASCA